MGQQTEQSLSAIFQPLKNLHKKRPDTSQNNRRHFAIPMSIEPYTRRTVQIDQIDQIDHLDPNLPL